MARIVIESPLSAPDAAGFARNYRYLLWCCRAVWERDRHDAIGSHMLNPWFMNDADPAEREAGIRNSWTWGGEPHWFFVDLGISHGMRMARDVSDDHEITLRDVQLATYSPECWAAFERGEWPPHTHGFELALPDAAADRAELTALRSQLKSTREELEALRALGVVP